MGNSLHIEIKNLILGRSKDVISEEEKMAAMIERSVQGDSSSQRYLFMELAPKMKVVCRRYAANEAQAKDFMQEGFIRFFDKLYTFRGGAKLETWATRLFVNNCLTLLRKEKRRKEKREDYLVEKDLEDEIMLLSEEEEEMISPELILNCIAKLPEGYRTVLNLFIYEERSHKEIAELLGISVNTSKTQFFKAKKMLKKLLEEATRK